MKLRITLLTVLAITSTVTFADNRSGSTIILESENFSSAKDRSKLTQTLANGTFKEDSSIPVRTSSQSRNKSLSSSMIKNGIFMYNNVLPDYYHEPIKVNDPYDFAYIDLLYAKLGGAQAAIGWYQRQYEKNQPQDELFKNFTICQEAQDIQEQIAFYANNVPVINASNKVSKVKFDVQERTNELNKNIEKMLQPLGNRKCTDIQQELLKKVN
ncbi:MULTISPECIES: hypothetical protein [unclassified Acinetobacter]|uniref:hypothetical protein n=1 Tax=unclassified Acinetobacter TaxID=196816 RepID=UPI0015D24C85|nr:MULTISPECIES: hypothetical protein [unclassified Acinetobacter]